MAMSDNYNNNNSNQKQRPTLYSNYRMSNIDSSVDKTSLTFTFWNGMLKITIAPLKEGATAENISFDYENTVPVYLTHTKALLLLEAIKEYETNKENLNSIGVPAGKGLLYLSNGKEFGKAGDYLVIKKINEEDGSVESSFTYQFNTESHFMVKDFADGNFDRVIVPNLELEQLKTMLREFCQSSTGAYAYSNIDYGRFDNSRINTKIELVMDKLGIERTGKKGNGGGGSSYFNKPSNGGQTSSNGMNTGFSKSDNVDDMFE